MKWAELVVAERSWPDLVGKNAEEAKSVIESESPHLTVHIVSEHSLMTMDYNMHRVRIFVNRDRTVVKPPIIG